MNQSFLEHLEELRRVLLKCLAGFALALPVGIAVAKSIIDLLLKWSAPEKLGQLHFFAPLEMFIVQLRVGAVTAIVLSFPWGAWKIWEFVLPALTPKERKAFLFWIVFASVLFASGAAFCVAVVLPLVMSFAAGFATENIRPLLGVAQFISLAGMLALAFGVAFQTPVAVCIAVKFGLVKTASLKRTRPYAVVLILIIAAALTPPDVLSQVLLAVPMYGLYEAGILFAGRYEKTKRDDVVPDAEPAETSAPKSDDSLSFYDEQRDK